MNSELFKSLNNEKKHSVYTYLLLNSIEYYDKRDDNKKYLVWCSHINKPFPYLPGIHKEELKEQILIVSSLGYPFTQEEIGIIEPVEKPKPKFIAKGVNNSILPEKEKNPDVKNIRTQLINNPSHHTVTMSREEMRDYYIVVEKSNDNDLVNYKLYVPSEYYSFIASLDEPLLEICKQWNDEEYIRLLIQLNEWKRKEENSESKKLIQYLSEIKGKFDIWYLEHKLEIPNLVEMIKELEKQIVEYASTILRLKSELNSFNSKKETLEKQFDKDITDFPLDLEVQLTKIETAIKEKQNQIAQKEKVFWGTFDNTFEGLLNKHERLEKKYKKIYLSGERFKELSDKSSDRGLGELGSRISGILRKNNIEVDEIELNDLSLKIINIVYTEDKILERIINPEKAEENLSAAIDEVLKNKFNISNNNIGYGLKAEKKIKLKMSDAISEASYKVYINYSTIEAKIAYLKLVSSEAIKYFKNKNEWGEENKQYVGLIDAEIYSLEEALQEERDKNKPLGFAFTNEVIEIELDMYDTVEEQIDYLKQKIKEFEIATINVYTNEYDEIRDYLKHLIKKREKLLKDDEQFGIEEKFNEYWNKIVEEYFDNDKINDKRDKVGIKNEDAFIEFITRRFKRRTIDEWMRHYAAQDKADQYQKLKSTNLPPEVEYQNSLRIANAKFEDSTLGKYALQNLRSFDSKYVRNVKGSDLEFEELLNKYYEYGKECYLKTWKDENQILTFEKKMIEYYGQEVREFIWRLYSYLSKKINPIEFIGCNYEEQRKNFNEQKLKNEIIRIDGYIKEIEDLSFFTDDPENNDIIPDDELEKYEEWQCYYIDKIKDKELAEWINCLRRNRPGVTDYKYGEFYPVDFNKVTQFALKEFKDYRDSLQSLYFISETKFKNRRQKFKDNESIADEVCKLWDNGFSEEFEEIYQKVSDCSEELFGVKLTKNQIKGRYQRFSNKHKDYRREKGYN